MSDACEWVGYCIDEGIGDLQRAAGTLGALDELSMAHDADELRRMVRDSEVGALGVIVGMTSDGVSDVNLAAAIARDGRARVVALVRRGASGSACFDDGIAEELYVWGFAGPSGVQIYSKQIKNSL